MRKKKAPKASIRIDEENTKALEDISKKLDLHPTLPQMVNTIVRKYRHTLFPDNRPG